MGLFSFGKPKPDKLKAKKDVFGLMSLCRHQDEEIRNKALKYFFEFFYDQDGSIYKTAVLISSNLGSHAIPHLIKLLDDEEGEKREAAVWALGNINDPKAIDSLLQMLKDKNSSVRAEAITALTNLNYKELSPILISNLDSSNDYIRGRAASALGELHTEESITHLIGALNDESWYVVRGAVKSLGKIKSTECVNPIIHLLKNESTHEKVIASSLKTLGHIKDNRALESVLGMLDHSNEEIRRNAAWALGEFKNPKAAGTLFTRLSKEPNCIVWVTTLNALIKIGKPADKEIIQLLRTDRTLFENVFNTGKKDNIIDELETEFGEDVLMMEELHPKQNLKPLIQHLKYTVNPWDLDALAVDFLRDTDESLKLLFETLMEKDLLLKFNAMYILRYFETPEVERKALDLLTDQDMRPSAIRAINLFSHPQGVQPLLGALIDKDVNMRIISSKSVSDPRAVLPLIDLLEDKEPIVRNNAAESLGVIKDLRAIKPLIDTLDDDTELERAVALVSGPIDAALAVKTGKVLRWKVRDVSASALEKITGQKLPVESWQKWWSQNKERFVKKNQ